MGLRGPPCSVFTLGAQPGFQTLITELLNEQPEGKQGHMHRCRIHACIIGLLSCYYSPWDQQLGFEWRLISQLLWAWQITFGYYDLCVTIQKQSPYWYISINYISTSLSYHVIINPVSSSKNKRIMNANAKAPAYTGVHCDRLAALFCLSLTPGIIPTGLIWTSLHPLVSSCFGQ